MATPASEELIYGEAARALQRQQAVISELRAGAALLIATAAVSVSLLTDAAEAGVATTAEWVALGAFVIVCASAIAVVWPRRRASSSFVIDNLVRDLTLKHVQGSTRQMATCASRSRLRWELTSDCWRGTSDRCHGPSASGSWRCSSSSQRRLPSGFSRPKVERMFKRRKEEPFEWPEAARRFPMMDAEGRIVRPEPLSWREYFRWFFFG